MSIVSVSDRYLLLSRSDCVSVMSVSALALLTLSLMDPSVPPKVSVTLEPGYAAGGAEDAIKCWVWV